MSLFPTWADSALRLALVGVPVVVVGVPLLSMAWVRGPIARGEEAPLMQPIDFDHRHHVRDDGIDCLFCHFDADRAPVAGVPDTRVCMHCHSQVWRGSPLLAPLLASWSTGEPIAWQRVHDLPDFVFFSHEAHVTRGVECAHCHGDVGAMPNVVQVVPLTMSFCVDCHRARSATTDCNGCHR